MKKRQKVLTSNLKLHESSRREIGIEDPKSFKFSSIIPYIDFFHYKRIFKHDSIQQINLTDTNIFFGITLGDAFMYVDSIGKSRRVNKYELFCNRGSLALQLKFEESKSYEFLLFSLSTEIFKKIMKNTEFESCSDFSMRKHRLYKKKANLRTIKEAGRIGDRITEGMRAVGQMCILLKHMVKHFFRRLSDVPSPSSQVYFKGWEIDELLKISQEIYQFPGKNYSVDGVSKSTGLNIPRLQAGFKEMHDLTVALYIREARLQKAEKLIRMSNYNISQIVYNIGLTSRSYFSKIFKEKYGYSPSEYKNNF